MKILTPQRHHDGIEILPRWPQKNVCIDTIAFDCLKHAQSILHPDIQLVLTRGYQPELWLLRFLRHWGSALFGILYPTRKDQIPDIFQHNGHATDGTHIDVGIRFHGKILTLLPFSVFTPAFIIDRNKKLYGPILSDVMNALVTSGFTIHPNATESLQIHCDLIK